MREALSHALHSSLTWDDSDHERAIDKLTAFSMGDRLGTLLWRVKFHNEASSYKPAVLLLAKHLKTINGGIARRIAEQALHEWIFSFCPSCLGAKEVRLGEKVVSCHQCFGSGVRKFTDNERKVAIGAHMPKQLKAIHDLIGEYDREISRVMHVKLGR